MCCAFLKTGRIFSFLPVPVMVIYDGFGSESGLLSYFGWESVDKESIVSQGFPENLSNYEAYPPQGLSEARRDRNVYRNFQSRIHRGGFPLVAAASITTELYSNPSERWISFRNEPVYKCLF
jgi:hypothetical protein